MLLRHCDREKKLKRSIETNRMFSVFRKNENGKHDDTRIFIVYLSGVIQEATRSSHSSALVNQGEGKMWPKCGDDTDSFTNNTWNTIFPCHRMNICLYDTA